MLASKIPVCPTETCGLTLGKPGGLRDSVDIRVLAVGILIKQLVGTQHRAAIHWAINQRERLG
jgi:hypothetical protein